MPAANPALVLGAEAGRLPLVRVLDQQGTLIRSFVAYDAAVTGGVRTAVADLNRDGVNDIVTAPGPGAAPLVKVWDGASGSLLNQFWAYDPAFRGGVQVAAGDIGRGEVGVVTAPDQGSSQVRVFNSQGVLRTGWDVFGPSSTSGVRVALGYAANGNAAVFAAAGPGSASQVKSIEIRTGQTLASFTAYAPTMTGGVWIVAADLTGDGVSEIVTGAGPGSSPQVKVFSGTGRPLTEFLVTSASDRNGVQVGVVTGREGQPQIATLVGSGRSKQVRLFDPHSSGTPAPLASYRAVGTGSLGTPSDRSEVKRFDAGNPTPRTLRQVYRHRAIEVTAAGYSAFPVRYGDGVVHFVASDLAGDGFGTAWGVTRSWTNEGAYSQGQNVGRGWIIAETPSLFREVDPFSGAVVLTVVTGGTAQQVFDEQPNGSYLGRGGILDTLVYESTTGQYCFTAPDGTELWFWDFDAAKPAQQRGQFARLEDPKGNVTEVTTLLADGRISEVQRSAPASGSTVTESYLFSYVTGGVNDGLIASITQRRRVGTGPWSTVRKAEYVYYDGVEPHGSAGDLKKVVVKDAADAVLETSYYRYYVAGENNGYEGGLKFVFRPQAYARLAANVSNPETATDAEIAPYADHYFEYDDQFRVTKEIAAGAGDDDSDGRGTFTFSYTVNSLASSTAFALGAGSSSSSSPNAWLVKTVETLPDGNQNIVYTNANRQVMLKVFQETATSQQWRSFYQYDASGRLILAANPSAVTGYDETSPDLLVNQWGNYQYLSDTTGLITTWTYGTVTTATETTAGDAAGRLKQVAIRRDEFGTAVPQQDVTYIRRTAGGSALFFVATVTAYRHDDGTGPITTSYAYTWQGTTAQPESITVTLPIVSAAQNGSGTATTVTTVFDAYGRPIWQKDGSGFLTYLEYDPATGAVLKEIRDVDTTQRPPSAICPAVGPRRWAAACT
jgi:hypothetical protein